MLPWDAVGKATAYDYLRKSRPTRLLGFAVMFLLFLSSGASIANSQVANSSSSPTPITPIQHIVIIMQENHAFENMFGTYPGLPSGFALNMNTCMPSGTTCVYPFNADSQQATVQGQDICHTRVCAVKAYDGGKMDKFLVKAKTGPDPMAYYTGQTLPYYWDYASHFALDYNFMSSALSFSLPNHLYAVAAQAGSFGTCTGSGACTTQYDLTFPQIGQSLTSAGISWGYYQYNWNDAIDCPSQTYTPTFIKANTHGGYDGYWSGLADFVQVQHTAVECSSLQNYNDLANAISSNKLPSVSWVEPAPSVSDHPAQSTWLAGQQYVSSLINLIEHSQEWSSTVIYLTWDDWGGYYDNVVPLQFDAAGEGFRVPLIAISPYSIPSGMVEAPSYNYGSGFTGVHQEDFSAFLSTIEYNWGLSPLTLRDTYEPNLFFMLNFHQQPLAPLFLAQSGVTYPLSSCSPPACTASASTSSSSSLFAPHIVISPNVGNESQSQALNYSGDGDAGD